MKKLTLVLLSLVILTTAAFAQMRDVPSTHWAYDAIRKVQDAGIIQGYPDGTFQGGRKVNRFVLAMVVAKILDKVGNGGGVDNATLTQIQRLTEEFSEELKTLGVKVTAIEDETAAVKADVAKLKKGMTAGDCASCGSQKLNINGLFKWTDINTVMDDDLDSTNDHTTNSRMEFDLKAKINKQVKFNSHIFFQTNLTNNAAGVRTYYAGNMNIESAYLTILEKEGCPKKDKVGVITVGKYPITLGHGIMANNGIANGFGYKKQVSKDWSLGLFYDDINAVSGLTDATVFMADSKDYGLYYLSLKQVGTESTPTWLGLHGKFEFNKDMKLNLEYISNDNDPVAGENDGNAYLVDFTHKLSKDMDWGLIYAAAGEQFVFNNAAWVDAEEEKHPLTLAGFDATNLSGYTDIALKFGYKLSKAWKLKLQHHMVSANDDKTGVNPGWDIMGNAVEEGTPFDVTVLNFENEIAKDTTFEVRYSMLTVGDNDKTAGDDGDTAAAKNGVSNNTLRLRVTAKF